ncbi:hypothetical protein F5878DRAFT_636237 [Lentinula raphanica]|uniref:Uncharacterized protein n=1 Tax=Lentinula raphanica TaxID=153919 RepID=A0AA38U9V7_9AGAR|nr:hypothetical protein F5878DRAFT_636237 [Lentinula raphanica]
MKIADGIETGTVYLNRCDYLDPALPWTGVSLSQFGELTSRSSGCFLCCFAGDVVQVIRSLTIW